MAKDHRIERNGERLDCTCENWGYKTNIDVGRAHGSCDNLGSVFQGPLADRNGYSLWLEHVIDKRDPSEECYWLMWRQDGKPAIPLSGILTRRDIEEMGRLFVSCSVRRSTQLRGLLLSASPIWAGSQLRCSAASRS
jgi:hypothetical protein